MFIKFNELNRCEEGERKREIIGFGYDEMLPQVEVVVMVGAAAVGDKCSWRHI